MRIETLGNPPLAQGAWPVPALRPALREAIRDSLAGILGSLAARLDPSPVPGLRLAQSDEFRNPAACPLGGCSATDLRMRWGVIAPRPRWDGANTYFPSGRMTPLDHIKARHFWRSGGPAVPRNGGPGGMFAKGTTKSDLEVYARVLHREGVHTPRADGSWKIAGRIEGKIAGYTDAGKRTSRVEMIVGQDGLIRTMYPAP